MKAKKYFERAVKYAKDVVSRKIVIGEDVVNACQRFLDDLERDDVEVRTTEADAAVSNMMKASLYFRSFESL